MRKFFWSREFLIGESDTHESQVTPIGVFLRLKITSYGVSDNSGCGVDLQPNLLRIACKLSSKKADS